MVESFHVEHLLGSLYERLRKIVKSHFLPSWPFIIVAIHFIVYARSNAGTRLWARNLFSGRPRLDEVQLEEKDGNCWKGYFAILRSNKETEVTLQICSGESTELEVRYADPLTESKFHFFKDNVQRRIILNLDNESLCIGGRCPPVSVSGNYIGVPTMNHTTGYNYYIFLLPFLTPRKHGIIDLNNTESIDMLWNDVIGHFEYSLLTNQYFLLFLMLFIPDFWNSKPARLIKQWLLRLCKRKNFVDLVHSFVNSLLKRADVSLGKGDGQPLQPVHLLLPGNDQTSESNESDDDYMSCISEDNDINDPAVLGDQRSEESSDCESLASTYQEQNRCKPSRPIYQRSGGWYDSGTSDNQTSETSETSESDDDYLSVTSEDYDTSSDSSISGVEDTHSPPMNFVPFSSEGVVFEDYSEQTRQDPVGGE